MSLASGETSSEPTLELPRRGNSSLDDSARSSATPCFSKPGFAESMAARLHQRVSEEVSPAILKDKIL